MLEVFKNESLHRIQRVMRTVCAPSVQLRRIRLTSIPALLVQRRLRWLGHAVRRPEGELIEGLLPHTSHVAQTSWRPAENMGNHDQCRPGTALRTASLRPRTMEKELGEIGGANKYLFRILIYSAITSGKRVFIKGSVY